jgi:hypothetical protein
MGEINDWEGLAARLLELAHEVVGTAKSYAGDDSNPVRYAVTQLAGYEKAYARLKKGSATGDNEVPEVVCILAVYSNYDCTNSYDTMKSSTYLQSVHRAVKGAVTAKAMMREHMAGAYGGALLCFVFRTTRTRLCELRDAIDAEESVLIPKGTQFGFHSAYSGATSPFDETTRRDLVLPATYGPTEYDRIDMLNDRISEHSLRRAFGGVEAIRASDVRPVGYLTDKQPSNHPA